MEVSGSLIFPQASQTGVTNLAPLGLTDGTPNSGQDAFVLASYTTIRLTDRIWAGVAINSPFGLETAFENPNWAGAFYGQTSTLHTYTATPSIAIKVFDWLSIGGGFQAERGQVNFKFADAPPIGGQVPLAQAQGHGWGFGWTAGATITPTATTQIGLGYRSGLDQQIKGNLDTGALVGFGTPGTANTTIKLPGIASLGVRQGLTPQFTLLGTVEWTNWNRIGTSTLVQGKGPRLWLRPDYQSRSRSNGATAGSTPSASNMLLHRLGRCAAASPTKPMPSRIRSACRSSPTTVACGIPSAPPTRSATSRSTSPTRSST
jgi:long-chain fatty acid transport protein